MTALILPFPGFFRPAIPRDEMADIIVLPVIRIDRECPKVQELRVLCKIWLERKRQFSGGTCSGGE